jgi:hypothetical protein
VKKNLGRRKLKLLPQKENGTMQYKVSGPLEYILNSGTNDSSIVSKRSVERTGYNIKTAQHQWFRHFVKKPARRAPLINLGYFVRMKAIEKVVDEVRLPINLIDV